MRAAIDSEDEISLTQNTFSQEPFSHELNLEELVGDFRKQCILPHSTTEIQVYGCRYDTYKYRSFTVRVQEDKNVSQF